MEAANPMVHQQIYLDLVWGGGSTLVHLNLKDRTPQLNHLKVLGQAIDILEDMLTIYVQTNCKRIPMTSFLLP